MGTIDEVKQRTDIVEIIGQYVPLAKAGRTYKGLCPFHSEKHPSFYAYPDQQSWHCFGCNKGGDVFSFLMKKEDINFGDALRLLADKAGVTIAVRHGPDKERETSERLYQINQAAAGYFHNILLNSPEGKKARNYLIGRGLSAKTTNDFQLGFSLNNWEAVKRYLEEKDYNEGDMIAAGLLVKSETGGTHDRFRNKLMFPIQNAMGHVTGFGARVLDDSLPKYINSPQTPIFDKSSSLYGINLARDAIKQKNTTVIVEGYMDVMTAHQNGFNNVVASLGTSITEKQVLTLKNLTKNITLALDADTAGGEAMLRGVSYENILNTEVKVILLPEGKDPDSVIRENAKIWQDLLKEALPVIDYAFNMVISKIDPTTAQGKTMAMDRLLPIIAEIKNDAPRDHYLRKLAELLGTSYNSIEAILSRIKIYPRTKMPRQKVVSSVSRSLLSSPQEEYCLALLLQYPDLKNKDVGLVPEYFENSENREIFIALQKFSDIASAKNELDITVHDHFDHLKEKEILGSLIEQKYDGYVLRLKEKFLRSLETKKEGVLASEAKSGGTTAELTKLEEQGIENSVQLGKLLVQRIKGDRK